MNVLLVEDEPAVADFVDRGLRAENHFVAVVDRGAEAVEVGDSEPFDVIVLDLILPDLHGYDVCQRLRHRGNLTPILMLTALDSPDERVRGLRLGADDYLTKPFDFDELLARLEALVRRAQNFKPRFDRIAVGDLVFDRARLELRRGGHRIQLSTKELALLELLMSAPGRVFSRTRILNCVWGLSKDPLTNVVDVYIGRLRRKVDLEGCAPLIETVRGHGYRIRDD